MRDKLAELHTLGNLRKQMAPEGFQSIAEFESGAYDSDFVSPYTKGAGNVDSPIVVLLHDWCSADFLAGPFNEPLARLGRDPKLPTNRNLEALLTSHFGLRLDEIFATNVFPWIKPVCRRNCRFRNF